MAYALYTQSYGVANANKEVQIRVTATGAPVILLASATGGLISDQGLTFLDASGNLSVYLDTAVSVTTSIVDSTPQTTAGSALTSAQLSAGAAGVVGVTTAGIPKDLAGNTLTPLSTTQVAAGAVGVPGVTSGGNVLSLGGEVYQSTNVFSNLVVDVTRNSQNDATDASEMTLATLVVPGGRFLRVGSLIEVWCLFENTSSAATKTVGVRFNGTSVGTFAVTTNQSTGVRLPFHVQDQITLVTINNGGVGSGSAASAVLTYPSTAFPLLENGFTVTITAKWNAAASGEFIRIRHAKINYIL